MPKAKTLILKQDDKRLRQISQNVPIEKIKSLQIKKIIKDMGNALEKEDDGVAIAAPQIGQGFRIFIVSHRIFEQDPDGPKIKNQIYINPEIVKTSRKMVLKSGEGCLSVRWLYGKVKRYTNVTIKYYDEHGELHTRGAGGLLAHIFQHEIDHLNGILFIDKAIDVEEILPENNESDAK